MKVLQGVASKWWFKWLLIGVAIRLILMPITFHPDLWGQSITFYFFSYKGIFNVYEHIRSLPGSHPLVQHYTAENICYIFIYPPLTYFTQGLLNFFVRPFLHPDFFPALIQNPSEIFQFANIKLQIFLLKLPYLFVDIATAFVLANIFSDKNKQKIAFMLWMFNPLSLYATFMMGQNDILPVFFSVLSIYFIKKKRYFLALLSLGVGGSYKLYPLLFVIPAAVTLGTNIKERMKFVSLGFLPYLITTLPFLSSPAYRSMVLLNPESTKMLFMGFFVSSAEMIFPFILILIFIYFCSYYQQTKVPIVTYYIFILLLIFSVTHYHPQWFFWVTPFLIWALVKYNFRHTMLVLTLLGSWLLTTLFFEPSLSHGLFSPVIPDLKDAVGLTQIVADFYDPNLLKSIIRSIFAGTSLYYLYDLLKLPNKR